MKYWLCRVASIICMEIRNCHLIYSTFHVHSRYAFNIQLLKIRTYYIMQSIKSYQTNSQTFSTIFGKTNGTFLHLNIVNSKSQLPPLTVAVNHAPVVVVMLQLACGRVWQPRSKVKVQKVVVICSVRRTLAAEWHLAEGRSRRSCTDYWWQTVLC